MFSTAEGVPGDGTLVFTSVALNLSGSELGLMHHIFQICNFGRLKLLLHKVHSPEHPLIRDNRYGILLFLSASPDLVRWHHCAWFHLAPRYVFQVHPAFLS